MKFLGTVFDANNHLRLNATERRKKCMSSFNAIYGRIGKIDNISILIFLLGTICTPTLLYGIEIFSEDKTEKNGKSNTPFERAGMKIFSTFDKTCPCQVVFFTLQNFATSFSMRTKAVCYSQNVSLNAKITLCDRS